MKKRVLFKVLTAACALCAVWPSLTAAYAGTAWGPSPLHRRAAAHSRAEAPDTVVSWGLKYNTREQTPEPPRGSEKMLKEHNGIFTGDTKEKKVYFTFDLGYEAGFTAEVLDILKENDIKGIFFLCGNYLKEKELIGRMIAEGHEIGNHTDRHKDLPALCEDAAKKDIADLQEKINAAYPGTPVRFFRPPQGRFNENTLRIADAEGLKTTLWSIAIVDWGKAPINAAANAGKIAERLHPGAIVLFHITNAGTPEMLKLLIPKIAGKGYRTGVPPEL